jgi:hypothetical protein
MCSGQAQVWAGDYKGKPVQCCAKRIKGRGMSVSCHQIKFGSQRAQGASMARNINRQFASNYRKGLLSRRSNNKPLTPPSAYQYKHEGD